jgi:hypothetical protein
MLTDRWRGRVLSLLIVAAVLLTVLAMTWHAFEPDALDLTLEPPHEHRTHAGRR